MAARYTALLALAAPVLSENNGRAVTPPMGALQGAAARGKRGWGAAEWGLVAVGSLTSHA